VFKGFVQRNKIKDRAVYICYKKWKNEKNLMPYRHYALDNYYYERKDKGVKFIADKNSFTKEYTLNAEKIDNKERDKRFGKELKVYNHFKEIDWKYSPKLLNYSREDKTFVIERLKAKSIHQYLTRGIFLNINWLERKIKNLEKEFIRNKIDCRGITNKDLLIGDNGLWLVDFEETDIDQAYSESLPLQLLFDLNGRWKTFYLANKQKSKYRRMLIKMIFGNLKRNGKFYIKNIFRSGKNAYLFYLNKLKKRWKK
jgi:hypothetical protein